MKRIILVTSIILILALALTGCGKKNKTPTVEISADGYWVINGEKTNVKAEADISSANPQGLNFYPTDDGNYIVSVGNAKFLSKIVIPETYLGGKVVGIDDNAFDKCDKLTEIVIPNGVTEISNGAFSYCTSLTSIVIPSSVTSIGMAAFYNCESLTTIYFTGSEAEWSNITIDRFSNDRLNYVSVICNYVPEA